MHDEQKAGEGAEHGEGAMGKIDSLGGLVNDDQSKRGQSVDGAELYSRNQHQSQLCRHSGALTVFP